MADFVHGKDGLGNIFLPDPNANKIDKSASEFLVEKVSESPGEVTVLALGPLTNIALVSCILLSCTLWSWLFDLGNFNLQCYTFFDLMFYLFVLGNQKRFIFCKQGEANSCTWWCILCLGECQSSCRSKCKS